MIESVHCPECQTHYGLRRDRVRYGLRRARCFRCEGIFPIEEEVTHLLAAGLPMESVQESSVTETFSFAPSVMESVHAEAPVQEPFGLAEMPEVMPDSLTLQDLEGAEDEILDKTLVDFRPPEMTYEAAPPEAAPVVMTTGGFSSALDAINKLLGDAPAAAEPTPQLHSMRAKSSGGGMDVEATLNALDDTLGGNRTFHEETLGGDRSFQMDPSMPTPQEMSSQDWDASLLDLPEPPPPPAQASPATVRLTREEMMAAMNAPVPEMASTTGMPLLNFPEAHEEMESTLVMMPPPMDTPSYTPPPPPVHVAPSAPTSFMPIEEAQDQNLFRVQLGTDTLSNLTMEQMTGLVNEGRLADYHMVARQFSENWIEAGKVPALRPVFERYRREHMPAASPVESEVPKRSLFGGLFGKKEG